MQIIFNIPHAFYADSPFADNAVALRALLDCMIELNMGYLKLHRALPLYQSGVRYDRTTWWEPIPALYARKYGDCKSLATALVAEYRLRGIAAEPVFRFIRKDDGTTDFHILVQTEHGFEDPSKVLGMGKNENARFYRRDGSVIAWDGHSTRPKALL